MTRCTYCALWHKDMSYITIALRIFSKSESIIARSFYAIFLNITLSFSTMAFFLSQMNQNAIVASCEI